jgi:hypothetical protein
MGEYYAWILGISTGIWIMSAVWMFNSRRMDESEARMQTMYAGVKRLYEKGN